MDILPWLTLTNSAVTIIREVKSSDGMGGVTTTTTITGIPNSVMWSPSQSENYISDKMAKSSTHVLVTLPSYYSFTTTDVKAQYNSETYRITGFDNVMNLDEIEVIGLEKVQ